MKHNLILAGLATAAALFFAGCGQPAPDAADNGASALSVIMNRKSVRSFTGEKISQEQIETILKAAMAAPTAINIQPWQFVVVNDDALLEQLYGGNPRGAMFTQAGTVIFVCGETEMSRPGRDGGEPEAAPNQFWSQDCSAATENLLLAVEALGLGAVWTALYPDEMRSKPIADALGLPENVKPLCAVPVGYPAGEDQPKDKWKPEKIHYNRW